MPRGFETRQTPQGPDVNGLANQPARQLPLVNVTAPGGGSVSQVGAAERALAEVMKLGATAGTRASAAQAAKMTIPPRIERQLDDERMLGIMDYAEGKTEADMQAEGVSRSRMEGFQTLRMKTAYNEWFIQQQKNIDEADHALDTDQYKAKLHEDWKALADSLDPNDGVSRKILGALVQDGFGKLIEGQVRANHSYNLQQSQESLGNLLYSESGTGDLETLGILVNNINDLAPNLPGSAKKEAVKDAMTQSLVEGNTALFDVVGGAKGLASMGFDAGEVKSILSNYKEAQQLSETENAASLNRDVNNIMLDIKTKNLSREEAFKRLYEIKDVYNVTDSYWRARVNEVSSQYFDRDVTEAEAAIMYNPEYIQKKADVLRSIRMGGLTESQGINKMLTIADDYGLPQDLAKQDLDAAVNANNSFEAKVDRQIDKQLQTMESEREKTRRSLALLNSNFLDVREYNREEQQHALKIKRSAIIEGVLKEDEGRPEGSKMTNEDKLSEVIRQHVDFLRDIPILDQRVVQDFQVVGGSIPTNEDGSLNEGHMQAFQYLSEMRGAGLSERNIRAYAGDAYEYLSIATELSNGATDPKTALQSAWEMTQVPKGQRPTPKVDYKETYSKWESVKRDFFMDLEPSLVASWFGAASDAKFDEVLTSQVKEAFYNSPDLDVWFKRRLELHSKAHPGMSETGVMALAKRDLSQWEYSLGNIVPPKDGKTLTQAMGLTEEPGYLVSNSAMLMYMRDNADLMFPKGSEESTWWTDFTDTVGDGLNQVIKAPAALIDDDYLGFSEYNQRLLNDIKTIDITPISGGQLMITLYQDTEKTRIRGIPTKVDAKDIGDWYKARTKEQQLKSNLPRR